ncbi:MAG TPA: hypothetical protein PLP34_04610 [Chitinophagaceae bacterium]|nr:hypothetical protein [Chitinophagaceae bacterium]
MKKELIIIFCVALLSFTFSYLIQWTMGVLFCYGMGWFAGLKGVQSFRTGFIGLCITWLLPAWWYDWQNQHILATRMALLFGMGSHPVLFIGCTALLGGLLGGISAWCGRLSSIWIKSSE